MQSILDGLTLGATQRAEGDDPAMIEGNHIIEKKVCVATGQVLVEMCVTNWATAQTEDPALDAVLHWLEAKKKIDLRTLHGEHASSEEGQWCGGIIRISQSSRMPSIHVPCPKGRMRIYYSLYC